ncbi:hypothetical protein HOY80DRAFT_1141453 [Tuber brumale]|nr:hypothetical protein HOY80DRAFT_1141453 [Tuber brumale]
MLLFRRPPSGPRFGFTSQRRIIADHKFASTLATNGTTAVTNQAEANDTKPAEPKTEKTIADGILTVNERISDIPSVRYGAGRGGAGRVWHSEARRYTGPGGIFCSSPPPRPRSFPGRGPISSHSNLTGALLGHGWGGSPCFAGPQRPRNEH